METRTNKKQAKRRRTGKASKVQKKNTEKLSVWQRARLLGIDIELAPGFSFDSDSLVKLY